MAYQRCPQRVISDGHVGDCAICQGSVMAFEQDYVIETRDGRVFHDVCFDNARVEAVEEATQALRPFALLLPHVERHPVRDDEAPIWQTNEVAITQGMVRAAVEALAALGDE